LSEAWVLHARIDGTAFGSRLSAAIQYCRNKLKSCTSGSKLHPAVYRLCQALQKEGKTTLAELIAQPKTNHSAFIAHCSAKPEREVCDKNKKVFEKKSV
jgi:hypothetical protein